MFFLQFTEIVSSFYPHFRILCCQLLPIKSQDIHFLEIFFYSLWPLGPLFIGESNIGRAQRFMSIWIMNAIPSIYSFLDFSMTCILIKIFEELKISEKKKIKLTLNLFFRFCSSALFLWSISCFFSLTNFCWSRWELSDAFWKFWTSSFWIRALSTSLGPGLIKIDQN